MTAQATLDLIIDADYRAQRGLRAFGVDLDKTGKKADAANRALESTKRMMGTGLNVAANVAKVGVAAVGVSLGVAALAAGKFISAGADVQESMGKFNVVFADAEGTVGKVTGELDAFAKSSGRNKFALREMAGGLGDILKPLGFNVAAAGDLSVSLSKLAVDLGSFNNMAPEEAFERIRGTLIGSHENALAFGVVINENTLKGELARMGADEFTGAMLEQAKVQARINLLIAGTSDAQGDALRTAGSWTNQQLRLNSIMQEFSAEMGLKLIPVLSPFLTMLGDLAEKWAPRAAEAMEGLIGKLDVEAIKTGIDEFVTGLSTGTFSLGSISFDLIPQTNSFLTVTPDGINLTPVTFTKQEIAIGDLFTFKQAEYLDGAAMLTKFGIGPIAGERWSVDGIDVINKLTIKDVFSAEITTDENGMASFKFNLLYEPKEDQKFVPQFDWSKVTKLKWSDLVGTELYNDDGTITREYKWSGIAKLTMAELFPSAVSEDGTISLKVALLGPTTADWWDDLFAPKEPVTFDSPNKAIMHQMFGGGKVEDIESEIDRINPPSWFDPSTWNVPEWAEPENWADPEWWASDKWTDPEWWASDSWIDPTWWKTSTWSKPRWWKFSDLSAPKWWTDLISALNNWNPLGGGGGGSNGPGGVGGGTLPEASQTETAPLNAAGSAFWRGGRTWVGEAGPELVDLPRGSRIYPSALSSRMAAQSSNITINVAATINNDLDVYELAYRLADVIQRA